MVGELRPRCRVCGKSSKGCGAGGCTVDQQTAQLTHKSRKRHLSAELDKKLAKEIEVIEKKIKTVKEKGLKSNEGKSKKTKWEPKKSRWEPQKAKTGQCEERVLKVPPPGQRSDVYQRFQEMVSQNMYDQNQAGLDHQLSHRPFLRKHPYNLRSGFWMQEAKTQVPPLSFFSTFNISDSKSTSKCCHWRKPDELSSSTPVISQSFMNEVDLLLKKAKSDTSKVSNLKI